MYLQLLVAVNWWCEICYLTLIILYLHVRIFVNHCKNLRHIKSFCSIDAKSCVIYIQTCIYNNLNSRDHLININQTSIWHFHVRLISNRCQCEGLCYLRSLQILVHMYMGWLPQCKWPITKISVIGFPPSFHKSYGLNIPFWWYGIIIDCQWVMYHQNIFVWWKNIM